MPRIRFALSMAAISTVFFIHFNVWSQPDPSTMNGKMMMGYQGWHACAGDGSTLNSYNHWSYDGGQPAQGDAIPDIWPDTSELAAGEQFATSLTMGNGQTAKAYSSYVAATVNRHFYWMQTNNLDGVMLQRFIWDVKGQGNAALTAARNQAALNVKSAAQTYSRVFALMYDMSGEPEGQLVSDMESDWSYVVNTLQLTNSSRYLKHNGKPVVAIWGIGFSGTVATTNDCLALINFFKNNGCTVMGGVPYNWRTLNNDSQTNANWLTVYHSLNIINPWAVGRYQNQGQADSFIPLIQADLADCQAHGIDYLPVMFPGYSSHNEGGGTLNEIPRLGGSFYWRQIYNALRNGCGMLYGAMFDEIDEGTALYKLSPTSQTTPNSGTSQFFALNVDGYSLPSDWYLRATAEATRSVHGDYPLNTLLPITPTNSITLTSPNGNQTLTAGNALTVTWTSTGTVGNVNIDVSTDNGKTFRQLVYNTANTGSKATTVPYYGNTVCMMRVRSTNGTPADWSDNVFTIQAPTANPNTHLSKLWSLAPGDRPYLVNTGTTERGIGYDSLLDNVFIVHRSGSTPFIYMLDGTTGADLGTLSTSGISGGTFVLDRIGVADDGVIYAGNVTAPNANTAPAFKLYRWSNTNSTPTVAYSGTAGYGNGMRVGDTFAVRGAGANTQILLSARGTNSICLLTTADGLTFTVKQLTTTLNTSDLGTGLTFGMANTFWAKTNLDSLFRLSFDTNAGTCTTLNSYANLPPGMSAVGVDETNNLLANIDVVDGADQFNLYDVSNFGSTPVLLHSLTYTQDNDNPFCLGSVCFGNNDRVYGIDANNGVIGASVLRKVVITSQPQSQTVNQGANVSFSVSATGSTLSYQWNKNGAAISGATTTSYSLNNVQAGDAATYTVTVNNSFSSATSANAVLTVIVPPAITTQPVSQTSNYGTTATFSVAVTGTSPSFQWQKNSVSLSDGGNVSGSTTVTLSLSSVTETDVASYRVIVSNAAGTVTSSTATFSLVDPVITSSPQSQTIVSGNPVSFTVAATGTAPVNYQWTKNGGAISGATASIYSIASAQSADNGSYAVIVSNAYGSPTSGTAVLTVVTPTMPYSEPFNYPAGSNLGGQTSPDGLLWYDIATAQAGNYVTNVSGNLTIPGLLAPIGNSILLNGLGKSARLSFPTNGFITNGTLYYSYALKMTNTNALTTSGIFVAGFNNSVGTQTGQPTAVGTRLYLRSTNGGFNIGMSKNSSTGTDWVWSATKFTNNQTVFLVGSYAFTTVGNTSDDVAKMWINPATNTFGGGSAPTATLSTTNGPDITSDQIASFVFCQRGTTEPTMIVDDLRIDRTWAGVTPPAGSGGKIVVRDFSLSATVLAPDRIQLTVYAATGTPCVIEVSTDLVNWNTFASGNSEGGYFQVSDSIGGEGRFYRVSHP